jgi:flagellar hook protein FlgE
MNTSFYNGLGGMKSSQVGIDVWGDNIANESTIGYKQQDVNFSSLFSTSLATQLGSPVTSDVGLSSTATSTTMNLSQGSIQSTDNVFDLALNGQGWMAVKDMNDETFYTRTGSFTKDANGTLVTQSGEKLQVANANNLTFDGTNWRFDATIPTNNLITQDMQTSPINLPDNVVFPPQSTTNISLGGNLPNETIAPNPKPAKLDNNFGVLYDANSQNINMKYGEDVVFGFGDNVNYSDGLARYDICIANDTKDNKPLNIDFDVNGKNIKLTLPDGSTSQQISDAIADELDKNNILYDKTNNSIQIKDPNGLEIQSNGGDLISSNSTIQKLVYNDNNTGNNFNTVQDFEDKLQNMATFTYGGDATVSLDDSGKLRITNNTDTKDIVASSYATDNSNDLFIQNLGGLGNVIKPNTASSSLSFNQNYQGFTGDIIDPNGNKNDLKFDFYKTKVDDATTTWTLNISEVDSSGNVISTQKQDLSFDNIGGLLTPTKITIDNNGTPTTINLGGNFTGVTSTDKPNTGFSYSQDGFIEGDLLGYDVDDNGNIIASFSNAKSGIVGQIPIYHFQNEQGLDSIGGNRFTQTSNSGNAFIYQNPDGSYLPGTVIKNYSLESSNVNMGEAMTQLIVIQKAYDANSKSITTSDQMIKKAIDMKR